MPDVGRVEGDIRPGVDPGDWGIADFAATQYGVVAHRQLLALGLGRCAIQHRLRNGRFHRIHRGVYAVGHEVLTVHGRWIAAVLAIGDRAVLSHTEAAALWGLHPIGSGRINVTTPCRNGKRHADIRVHRVCRLHPEEVTTKDRIAITSVARTLFDQAELVRARQLERLFEEAERQRLFDLRALEAVCDRNPGRRALRPIGSLLGVLREPPVTRSELEVLFRHFCRAHDIPEPAFNVAVEGYEVDAWWPGTRLIVELDSWGFHSSRSAFERDRERDLDLKLARFEVVRITDRRIRTDDERLARQLRRLLDTAARTLPPLSLAEAT